MINSLLNGRFVLVVEAEQDAAQVVTTGLREAGAKVVGAQDLRDAFHLAEHPALSAAILAQRLGDERTEAVCRRLSELDVPFMFHTRFDATEVRQKWPEAPIVTKPAETKALMRTIAELLH